MDDVSAAMHARDPVARGLGASIDRAVPGSATVSMVATEQMTNGFGVCDGGIAGDQEIRDAT